MPDANDRRSSDRKAAADTNWEAVALSRVARRVEQLGSLPAEAEDFGWEEGILEKLRQRLAAND
jgi:hypothetical protein